MMVLLILIALTNGFLVGISRILNARLGKEVSPAGASVWNHLTGALIVGVLMLVLNIENFQLMNIPYYAYLGGIIGAAYVTVSNFLIPKIGASKATVLMIAGQICLATLIDYLRNALNNPLIIISGIILIIAGVIVGERSRKKTQ
jgi:bacterial/archaeal transporter family-2 protein